MLSIVRVLVINFSSQNFALRGVLFVSGCGGGDFNVQANSPDFEEIEIPSSFMPDDLSSDSLLDDVDLVPEEMVYQFNLDELGEWGNNLDEAIRNVLAYDLNLDFSGEDESDFYGDTVEGEEFWSILADEIDGLDTEPGECS